MNMLNDPANSVYKLLEKALNSGDAAQAVGFAQAAYHAAQALTVLANSDKS